MINPQKAFRMDDYVEILLRRIWYFIIPFLLIITSVSLYVVLAEKTYRATTLVSISPQRVPESFVRPTITSTINDRLQSIKQEITSRTRLETLITDYKLYPKVVKKAPMEEVVEYMRRNIQVDLPTNQKEKNFFYISYDGNNPWLVAQITNKLASMFIEENLKFREQQAQGTSDFLENELTVNRNKLQEHEKRLSDFKRQHINELPENRDSNIQILNQLQQQNLRVSENLKAAEDRRILLQQQLADLQMQANGTDSKLNQRERAATATGGISRPVLYVGPERQQVLQLKAQLVELEAKYTGKHPDIISTRKKIAELESRTEHTPAPPSAVGPVKSDGGQSAFYYEERKNQLLAAEMDIKRLKKEEEKVRNQIALYQSRVESSPIRELALNSINQDYSNLKENYNTLLRKYGEAQQAENLERRQKGEQFRIIDPALVPEKAIKPNLGKVFMVGLIGSLFLGFGLVFLREQMDRSFWDAEDLAVTLGLRVLTNIPKVEGKAA
jgi:polysaccharide chain length determinant protein (PEP-CTERM system associated)